MSDINPFAGLSPHLADMAAGDERAAKVQLEHERAAKLRIERIASHDVNVAAGTEVIAEAGAFEALLSALGHADRLLKRPCGRAVYLFAGSRYALVEEGADGTVALLSDRANEGEAEAWAVEPEDVSDAVGRIRGFLGVRLGGESSANVGTAVLDELREIAAAAAAYAEQNPDEFDDFEFDDAAPEPFVALAGACSPRLVLSLLDTIASRGAERISLSARVAELEASNRYLETARVEALQRDSAMRAFFREHGSVIAWSPASHGKLVRDLVAIMAVAGPDVAMPENDTPWGKSEPEKIEELIRKCQALDTELFGARQQHRDDLNAALEALLEARALLAERTAQLNEALALGHSAVAAKEGA